MRRRFEDMFYILDGTEVIKVDSQDEWSKWFVENFTRKFLARTDIGDHWISTVFVGLNMNYFGSGPPFVFETMVFKSDESGSTDWGSVGSERTASYAEALASHERMCDWVRNGCQDEDNIHNSIDQAIRSMRGHK